MPSIESLLGFQGMTQQDILSLLCAKLQGLEGVGAKGALPPRRAKAWASSLGRTEPERKEVRPSIRSL